MLHKAIPFNDRLEKCVFLPNSEVLLLVASESSAKNTALSLLDQNEEVKPVKPLAEKYRK